jgi:translation elongation factor EF-1beta
VPIGYGIKKLQITAIIEDAKVESIDSICEEELVRDGESDSKPLASTQNFRVWMCMHW